MILLFYNLFFPRLCSALDTITSIIAAPTARLVAIMPKCLKGDKSAKKGQDGSRRRRDGNAYGSEPNRSMQRMVINSSADTHYDVLTELSAQLVNLKVSSSLQSKKKHTKCTGMAADKIKELAASNFSDAVQDNMTQLASTSQVSPRHRLEAENTKRNTTARCKNSAKEKRKDDRTTIVSANDKCRTKNLVTNQVGHTTQIFFLILFIIVCYVLSVICLKNILVCINVRNLLSLHSL